MTLTRNLLKKIHHFWDNPRPKKKPFAFLSSITWIIVSYRRPDLRFEWNIFVFSNHRRIARAVNSRCWMESDEIYGLVRITSYTSEYQIRTSGVLYIQYIPVYKLSWAWLVANAAWWSLLPSVKTRKEKKKQAQLDDTSSHQNNKKNNYILRMVLSLEIKPSTGTLCLDSIYHESGEQQQQTLEVRWRHHPYLPDDKLRWWRRWQRADSGRNSNHRSKRSRRTLSLFAVAIQTPNTRRHLQGRQTGIAERPAAVGTGRQWEWGWR